MLEGPPEIFDEDTRLIQTLCCRSSAGDSLHVQIAMKEGARREDRTNEEADWNLTKDNVMSARTT